MFMDDCVVISLLRHGLTKENEKKAYIGSIDSPLSKKGEENIRSINHKLPSEIIFTSPLLRSKQTAEIFFPNESVYIVPELKEMDFGIFEGKTYEELKNNPSYRHWLSAPFSNQPPLGEAFHEFKMRVKFGWNEVIEKLWENNLSSAVIVTHGGVIRQLLSSYTFDTRPFFEWAIPHGGGYQLIFLKDDFRRGDICMSLQEVPITEKPNGCGKPMN